MMRLPKPRGVFRWTELPPGPALVCDALGNVAHLFTTRPWTLGSSLNGNDVAGWSEVASAVGVGAADLVRVRQVHGASVVVVRGRGEQGAAAGVAGTDPGVVVAEADILLAQNPGVAIAIQTADCVPLLIADKRTGAVAAAHAGWRGLAARVPIVAVDALAREFRSRPEDLIAAVGPSISAARYEVDLTVLSRFEENGFSVEHIGRWFYDGHPDREHPDHWYFDGSQSAHDQLAVAGVRVSQIHLARLCTATHTDLLCSYRRDGKASGRMAAVIRARG
jgi:YfiH family protein